MNSPWWTYSLDDLLLFSPRVYWRLFELHNQAVWPAQLMAMGLGIALLFFVIKPRPWSDRAASTIIAFAWISVAGFLWSRYASINWAARYVVPLFVLEALLVLWVGALRGAWHFTARPTPSSLIGMALLFYALLVHPFTPALIGRPLTQAEIFALAPDPTVIATLGLLTLASGAVAWALLIIPLAWCLVSWATLNTMGAFESWVPLGAAILAIAARLLPVSE